MTGARGQQNVVITGANRGMGLAFVQQYLQQGERVFAACRHPESIHSLRALAGGHRDSLTILTLDTSDAQSIAQSERILRGYTGCIDRLINNAGIFGETHRFGELDFESGVDVLRTNALGPLLVTQHYRGLLAGGHAPKVVNLSSGYGSLSRTDRGEPYYYRASKAALNMFTRALAAELAGSGITVISIDPGWVATTMGGGNAPTDPGQAVEAMISVIEDLNPEQTGTFLTRRGELEPW